MAEYELRCRVQVEDQSVLWDAASIVALSYPDVTVDTVVEMIGARDDVNIPDSLLLILHSSMKACELLTLSCSAIAQSLTC
jgi:hypothetical protein